MSNTGGLINWLDIGNKSVVHYPDGRTYVTEQIGDTTIRTLYFSQELVDKFNKVAEMVASFKFPEPTGDWGNLVDLHKMDKSNQCTWLSDSFSSVCCNGNSDYCADFVDDEICSKCKHYEKTQPYLTQYMGEWVNEEEK